MTTIRHQAPGTLTSILTTELNSLANSSNTSVSADYDNSSNRYLDADLELTVTFGTAPTAGSICQVWGTPAVDGTNFATAAIASARLVATIPLDAVTTAQRIYAVGELLPYHEKYFLRNLSGQAFPASGSILKLSPRSIEAV